MDGVVMQYAKDSQNMPITVQYLDYLAPVDKSDKLVVPLWVYDPMIPPVRGWTGPDWTSPGLVQSSPRRFWTGIGPVHNSVGPGLDWTGLAWTSPALCPGLGYISHCIGLLMGEIYLDGTEYTDRTVIISPRVGIQR
jgi:hypothetical protein